MIATHICGHHAVTVTVGRENVSVGHLKKKKKSANMKDGLKVQELCEKGT